MRLTATLLCTALLLASCGGSGDPVALTKLGEKALGSQDFASALSEFEAALEAIGADSSHAYYLRARLGSIEARAATDAAKALAEVIELSTARTGAVDDADFNRIASRMASAGKFKEAVALLGHAKGLFPESAHLDKLGAKLASDAKKADDPEAMAALKGMGYVGE